MSLERIHEYEIETHEAAEIAADAYETSGSADAEAAAIIAATAARGIDAVAKQARGEGVALPFQLELAREFMRAAHEAAEDAQLAAEESY